MKRILLMALLLTALLPNTHAEEHYGILSITGDVGQVEIQNVGVFQTPITLALPAGNYTIKAEGEVEFQVKVFLNTSKLIKITLKTPRGTLIEGNASILKTKITYNSWSNHPIHNETPHLGLGGGCGGGWSPSYWVDHPYPLTALDKGDTLAVFMLNNSFTRCVINGEPAGQIFHVIAGPSFQGGGAIADNASFVVPFSRVDVDCDVKYSTGYLYSVSTSSMVTPFTILLPVVPQEVHNVTGVDYYGNIILIKRIPKIDTYNLSVGAKQYLLTSVIKLKPNEHYRLKYHLKTAMKAITIEEEPVKLYDVTLTSEPDEAHFKITGRVTVEGTTPQTLNLPEGEYEVIAFKNNTGAKTAFKIPENESVHLKLTPLPARLTLNTTPENARILVDGEPIENSTLTLPPGEHHIHASAPHYTPENLTILLAPNESKSLTIRLKPLPLLRIETTPKGARVEIENKTCTTPCSVELTPGEHVLRAFLEGYENETTQIHLKPGDNTTITLTLKKIKETPKEENTTLTPTPKEETKPSPNPKEEANITIKLLTPLLILILTIVMLKLKKR